MKKKEMLTDKVKAVSVSIFLSNKSRGYKLYPLL